jgi:hypothetical protein
MAGRAFSIGVETKNFNKHINQFLKRSNLSTNTVLKKFAFDLLNRIIGNVGGRKHPVLTGRARAGWYVAINKVGGSETVSTPEQQEGYALGKFTDHTGTFVDKWIEIINGVKYIIFLEYGSSSQAPAGMVRISMRELSQGKLPKELSKEFLKDWNKFYYGA